MTDVSFSELDTGRQCPLKWYLAYQQRWAKPAEPGGALSRGTLFHKVMEAHYGALKEIQEPGHPKRGWRGSERSLIRVIGWIWDEKVAPLLHDQDGQQTEEQQLIEWMYRGYVEHYGLDLDWEIIATEWAPRVALLVPSGEPSQFVLKLKVDLVIRDTSTSGGGKLWIVDHKSAKNLANQTERELDDQFKLYTWAARQLGRPVAGSVYNGVKTYRTKKPQLGIDRHLRVRMAHTEIELTNVALDAVRAATNLYGMAEVHSAPNPQQCSWKCDFRDAHIMMRKGVDPTRVLRDYGFERQVGERH